MEALLTMAGSDYSQVMANAETDIAVDERASILKAQRSDARAFETLYRLHVDKIYGLCLRMTGNVSEAEDCTQDAFVQAWRNLPRFETRSAFGTWLHRIAVNVVLQQARRRGESLGAGDSVERGAVVALQIDSVENGLSESPRQL